MAECQPVLYTAPNKATFEIGSYRPSDAPGIVKLFQAVYGDKYPIRLFYDPESIKESNANGQLVTTVVRDYQGDIVSVHNLFRSAPYDRIYEWGAGLTLKPYRNLGLSKANGEFLIRKLVPQRDDIQEVYGEAVCYHLALQKAMVSHSAVETALEVALMPAEAYKTEVCQGKRVATLFGSINYRKRPHSIYVPEIYEAQLKYIYGDYPDHRLMKPCRESVPIDSRTSASIITFDLPKVSRLAFFDIGPDFKKELERLELQALDRESVVIQTWLKLTTPWLNFAVRILRDRGYFLGGVLPRWFNDDGLLLQKLVVDPEFETIQLYTQKAKRILDMVKDDWAAVGNK